MAHFPLSWHYFNTSQLLEPTLSFLGGYAGYYVLTGVGLLWIHRRFVEPRTDGWPEWLRRHRMLSVFITGFIAGLPLNALMQFFWLKVGLFVYTEAAGPVLHIAGRQLPLLMVIYDSAAERGAAAHRGIQPAAPKRPHRTRLRPIPLRRRQGVRPLRPSSAGGKTPFNR